MANGAIVIKPSAFSDTRNEILTLNDGSELELNAQMRNDHRELYLKVCRKATQRRYV